MNINIYCISFNIYDDKIFNYKLSSYVEEN